MAKPGTGCGSDLSREPVQADEMRRMLSDNKIDTLVMKANP